MDRFVAYELIAAHSGAMATLASTSVRRFGRGIDSWSDVRETNKGRGDPARTFKICRLVWSDRDPMVVKAVSWALRALAKRDPAAVRKFMAAEGATGPALSVREVRNKLTTGRKSGKARAGGA